MRVWLVLAQLEEFGLRSEAPGSRRRIAGEGRFLR
jgi:hypothetical protein